MSEDSAPIPHGRILVVDDQRNMRATTALLLRCEGFSVLEAASGEEALTLLEGMDVDLMVTDLKMEPMDGLTLLQHALKKAPRLQVLIMTAFGSDESEAESRRLGACDYLRKPFRIDDLLQTLIRVMERSQRS